MSSAPLKQTEPRAGVERTSQPKFPLPPHLPPILLVPQRYEGWRERGGTVDSIAHTGSREGGGDGYILIRACTTVQTPSRGTNGRSFLSAEAEKERPGVFHRSDWSDLIPSSSALVLSVITEEGENGVFGKDSRRRCGLLEAVL